ncbi:MAG: NusG domain II-containing protein [Oliverpabstia sp.]
MKKRDIFVAVMILVAALLVGGVGRLLEKPANYLRITVNGDVYGIYALKEDQEIRIGDTNLCQIKDGKVRMISAQCSDQICVRTAEISRDGSTIVCLPNRVVLEVVSEVPEEPEVDTISS